MRPVAVAVPVPFLDLLTYTVPAPLEMPPVGARVRVPLGRRTVTGIVVEAPAAVPADVEVKDIVEAVDLTPFLDAGLSEAEALERVADIVAVGIRGTFAGKD